MPRYTCLTCGQPFTNTPRGGIEPRKYCSQRCYHDATVKSPAETLWPKVVKTKTCWLFMGRRNKHGYGRIGRRRFGDDIYAHHLAWQLSGGEEPNGRYLCHRCDVPNCVNPKHLYLGTPADNLRDAAERGRMPSGRKHWYHQKSKPDFRDPISGRFQKV